MGMGHARRAVCAHGWGAGVVSVSEMPPRRYQLDHEQRERLRDEFAISAPVTMLEAALSCGWSSLEEAEIQKDGNRLTVFAVLAVMRYEYADAMLAQRAEP